MVILTLEASTSSAKAMLYDSISGPLATRIVPYDREINDIATQDCDDICCTVLAAGRDVASGYDVKAIALCGTWHSLVVCDRAMKPVTRTYSWAYSDSAREAAKMRKDRTLALDLYHRTGCMIHSTYGLYTLLHLKSTGMELRDKFFASQSGYIFYTMTGERIESPSTMSGSGLLNVYQKDYDSMILSMLDVDVEQFGRLATYRETFPLLKTVADRLGVKEGIPVVPAYPDGAMNQVGAGALGKGIMTLSVGTSAAMRLTVESPMIPDTPSLWCYVGADSWVLGAATSGACSCVDWFRHNVLNRAVSFKTLEGRTGNVESTPVFLPFIFGERCPGWQEERLGGFFDISPRHSYASMYRGLLEGICFNLLQCYQALLSVAGEPVEIKLSGGIVNSRLWMQMLADILMREIYVARFEQASSLGTVALALFACGALTEISDFRVDTYRTIAPQDSSRRIYAEKYDRYLYWYDRTGCNPNAERSGL